MKSLLSALEANPRSGWMRTVNVFRCAIVSVTREIAKRSRGSRDRFDGASVRGDVSMLPLVLSEAESCARWTKPCDGFSARVGETYSFVSGLDALERICDARRRDRVSLAPVIPSDSRLAEAAQVVCDSTEALPEMTGVWFSQGRVHGAVSLAAMPKHGWFEMYAAAAR